MVVLGKQDLTLAVLRELRLRAVVRGECDPNVFAHVVEELEDERSDEKKEEVCEDCSGMQTEVDDLTEKLESARDEVDDLTEKLAHLEPHELQATGVIHDLKTWLEPFDAVWSGEKRHEVRQDDRGFAVGDDLLLRRWDQTGEKFAGRFVKARVTHITREPWVPPPLCVMSIHVLERVEA